MTTRRDVTPKTTERNQIVHTNKSKAKVTHNKKLRSRYCIIEAMKHTDRPEASRGLFATAELLVLIKLRVLYLFKLWLVKDAVCRADWSERIQWADAGWMCCWVALYLSLSVARQLTAVRYTRRHCMADLMLWSCCLDEVIMSCCFVHVTCSLSMCLCKTRSVIIDTKCIVNSEVCSKCKCQFIEQIVVKSASNALRCSMRKHFVHSIEKQFELLQVHGWSTWWLW